LKISRPKFLYKLIGVFVLTLAALVLIFFVFYRNNERLNHTYRLAVNNYNMLARSGSFLSELREVSGQLRGYILTGDQVFHTSLKKAIADTRTSYRSLLELSASDAGSLKLLQNLEPRIERRIRFAEIAAEITRQNRLEEARRLVASKEGFYLNNQITEMINIVTEKERSALDQAKKAYRTGKEESEFIFLALIAFILLMLVLVCVLITRNHRSRNRFEAQLKGYRHFFNTSNDLSCIANLQGYFELVSPRFMEMLGYTEKELLSYPIFSFIHPDDVPLAQAQLEKITTGGTAVNFLNRYRKADGTYIWLEWSVSTDIGSGKIYAIGRDIMARKKAEEELLALNRELESFSYSVSHDLRAPLRAVNGFAQILLEDHGEKLDNHGRETILTIVRNSKRMGELIDGLLAFSKLGRKDIVSTEIDMKAMVESVKEEQLHATKHEVKWRIGEIQPALGDRVLIKQVWVNLISNAIKYSQRKPEIMIEIGSFIKDHDVVYFVKDNGAGFDMKYYDKLFGVFQRLHSQEEFEGTGIGLAMINKIISRHRGTIWAESKVEEGSCFYFTLPAINNTSLRDGV
jgi:PAS domain S-box-containing protein